jgi:hypothetical protein
MTVLFASNFESDAAGSLPTGLATAYGSAFAVQLASTYGLTAPSGTKALASSNDGDVCLFTGSGALGNQAVRYDGFIRSNSTASLGAITQVLRSDASYATSAYRIQLLYTAGSGGTSTDVSVRIVSGGSSGSSIIATAAGALLNVVQNDILHMESRCIDAGAGSCIISVFLWKNGNAKPGTPSFAYTIASGAVSTGYPGVQHNLPGYGWELLDNLVITDGAGGEGTFDPSSGLTGNVTLDDAVAGGTLTSIASSLSGNVTLDDAVAAGTLGIAPGVITTPPLKNNTGTLLANVTGVVANVYNATTGAFVVRKTGLASSGAGVVTIIDPALAPSTAYAYEIDLTVAGLGRVLPLATAA